MSKVALWAINNGFWNETTKLWEECSKHRLRNLISDVLVPYFTSLQKDIYAQIQALGKNDKDKENIINTIQNII